MNISTKTQKSPWIAPRGLFVYCICGSSRTPTPTLFRMNNQLDYLLSAIAACVAVSKVGKLLKLFILFILLCQFPQFSLLFSFLFFYLCFCFFLIVSFFFTEQQFKNGHNNFLSVISLIYNIAYHYMVPKIFYIHQKGLLIESLYLWVYRLCH